MRVGDVFKDMDPRKGLRARTVTVKAIDRETHMIACVTDLGRNVKIRRDRLENPRLYQQVKQA